jgi:hypothetical protein
MRTPTGGFSEKECSACGVVAFEVRSVSQEGVPRLVPLSSDTVCCPYMQLSDMMQRQAWWDAYNDMWPAVKEGLEKCDEERCGSYTDWVNNAARRVFRHMPASARGGWMCGCVPV